MVRFVKPKPLLPGDTVGLIAPSDAIENTDFTVDLLVSWGLKVKKGKTVYKMVADFMAGTADERRQDLVDMIRDPKVKMIWAMEGGYAATEVLSVFSKEIVDELRKNPKWFIGYSDVCVILNALTSFKFVNLHGPMFSGINYWDDWTREWLHRILFEGGSMTVAPTSAWRPIISGEAEGRLIVSNLDSLIATLGTKFDPLMFGGDDVILGLEEWWTEKSIIQRQFDTIVNHKRFEKVKGVILGRFAHINEESYPGWGKDVTVEDLMAARLKQRGNIPLAVLEDFGHVRENNWLEMKLPVLRPKDTFLALPNGVRSNLKVGEECSLTFLENVADI